MKEFLTYAEAKEQLDITWPRRWAPMLKELCGALAATFFFFFAWYIVGKTSVSGWGTLFMWILAVGGLVCLWIPIYRYRRYRQKLEKIKEDHTILG